MSRRVVIVGGAGAFGFRLAEGLAASTDLAILIAGRDLGRAEAAARRLTARHPGRDIAAARLDARAGSPDGLARLQPWLVVDAAGPFQAAPPRLAEAAIGAGCHYVDLADARDFVAVFPRLDAAARAAGTLAVTGASSTPAISHAALAHLVHGWRRLDGVEVAICPGSRQPVGRSVVAAILAGAGKPLRLYRGGGWTAATGWSGLARRRLPGLGRRWLSLVETPDLDLVPQCFAPRRQAVFRAGLELGVLHLSLWALSRLVAMRLLPSLLPMAPALRWTAERLGRLGSDRGGMAVTAEGLDGGGRHVVAQWALVATAGDGPSVPTLPALALIRALAEGRLATTGAMPCVGLLSLADMEREFQRLRVVTRTMVRPCALFPRALGRAFSALPEAVRRAHEPGERLSLSGRVSVDGPASRAGRLVARLFGLPATARDVPIIVEMRTDGDGEMWTRTVAGRSFCSRLAPVAGRGRRIGERFGPFVFDLDLRADGAGLDLEIVGGRLGPLPLPRFLCPKSLALERVDEAGRFTFDVPVRLPGIGPLVHYRGWLRPQASPREEPGPAAEGAAAAPLPLAAERGAPPARLS